MSLEIRSRVYTAWIPRGTRSRINSRPAKPIRSVNDRFVFCSRHPSTTLGTREQRPDDTTWKNCVSTTVGRQPRYLIDVSAISLDRIGGGFFHPFFAVSPHRGSSLPPPLPLR